MNVTTGLIEKVSNIGICPECKSKLVISPDLSPEDRWVDIYCTKNYSHFLVTQSKEFNLVSRRINSNISLMYTCDLKNEIFTIGVFTIKDMSLDVLLTKTIKELSEIYSIVGNTIILQ
jgi:hypothetical protein